ASDYDNCDLVPQIQHVLPLADITVLSQQELDLLFGPSYDEFFNATTLSVNKSSSPTDNCKHQDTPPITNIHSLTKPTNPTNANAEENNDNQAEHEFTNPLCTPSSSPTDNCKHQDTPPITNIHSLTKPTNPTNANAEENNDNKAEHEFTNPFCTPVQEVVESSSYNISNSNVHTFNQPQVFEYQWTKDHPLEQVRRNPSKPVHTRRQCATDLEMCMFTLTVSTAKPKNIKKEMADSAWIEAMQEELH
nr:hypothetical protein [Tanacetum cinerariifolium]